MQFLLKNIKGLVQHQNHTPNVKKGIEMQNIPILENAFLLVENNIIRDFGEMKSCPQDINQVVDAEGKYVLPTWCDSHSHIVYAGSREKEFVMRINGADYEEIAKNGGGILNSAKRVNETPEEELLEQSYQRLKEVIGFGTGAIEIKSGYALTVEGELKMLRVIKKLKKMTDATIKATFLGAHAIPARYKENRKEYVDLITQKMLPMVAEEELADYCDVFCDRGFFTVTETDIILKSANRLGLKAKIHANELDYSGGIQIGVANQAISVDHLEYTGEAEIEVLKNSNTIPCLLPSTAFFLNLPYAPARKILTANLPIALATDYNPGSTPSGNMPFVLSLACIKMRMTPHEALNAATINGAYAMEIEQSHGYLQKGKPANFILTKAIPSLDFIPYSFGSNLIENVYLNGKKQ